MISPSRVALFTECYRPIQNGIVTSIDTLRAGLRARNIESVCFTPEMPGFADSDDSIIRLPSLPLPFRTAYRFTLPYLGARARAALQSVSLVHAHSPFITGALACRVAERLRVPLVTTYHTRLEYYTHYVPLDPRLTSAFARRATRALANASARVIVPSRSAERALRAAGVRACIDTIPTGVDVTRYAQAARQVSVREQLGARSGETLVLWVGRLAIEKNVPLALQTFAKLEHPRAVLALIGGGPLRSGLEAQALELGIGSRVHFAGEAPPGRLADFYAAADALLFTSTSETQGLVLAEALAAGLPVAAASSEATRETLQGEGWLAPPSPEQLAGALAAAVAAGRTGPGANHARLSAQHAVDRIIESYARALSG